MLLLIEMSTGPMCSGISQACLATSNVCRIFSRSSSWLIWARAPVKPPSSALAGRLTPYARVADLQSLGHEHDVLGQIDPCEASQHRQHGPEPEIGGNAKRCCREKAPTHEGEYPYHYTNRHVRSPQQRDRKRRREQAHKSYPYSVSEGFSMGDAVDIQKQRPDRYHQSEDPAGASESQPPVIAH